MTAEQRRGCDATQRPSAPILLSVCGTRTVSWNVLEQTKQVYYIHVHTHTRLDTNTYRPFKIKRQSEGERKMKLRTLVSPVSLGCSGLFWSLLYDTPRASFPHIFLIDTATLDHTTIFLGYYMSEVGGDWQMTKSSCLFFK